MAEEASLAIILRARDEASATIDKAQGTLANLGKAALVTAAAAGIAVAGIAVVATKMAADFQYTTETLVTGAGEDQKALAMVRQGVLDLAAQVGQTPQHLAEGLYLIESAGFHGAAGLAVLKSAAMGATVGAADMASVADVLTSALNAYRLPVTDAGHLTDVLLSTVAAGKMHLSDLAENLGKVLPIASIAKIPITEVAAAIATMTAQGTDASMATTTLRFLLTNLISPSSAAATEMKKMGLTAKELANDLSTKGLAGTMQVIQDHIAKHFPIGSQAYIAAMDKIVGGTRGMTAALELTGPNMKTFIDNAHAIGHASDGAGKLQEGWAEHSRDFNIVIERLKAGLDAVLITIGNKLLPVLTTWGLWFVNNLPRIQSFATTLTDRVGTAIQDVVTDVQIITGFLQSLGEEFDKHKARYEVLAGFIIAFLAPSLITMGVAFGVSVVTGVASATAALVTNTAAQISNAYWTNVQNGYLLIYYVRAGAAAVRTAAWTVIQGAHNTVMALWALIQERGIAGTAIYLVQMAAARVATVAWSIVQGALNLVMSLNPIGLIIIAIAALVAGIIFAYQHSETFRNIVNGLWDAMKKFGSWLWTELKPIFEWLWKKIQDLAGAVGNFLGAVSGLANIKLPGGLHLPGAAGGAVIPARSGGFPLLVGEGVEDEVVATASQMAQVGANMAGGGGGGTQTYVVPLVVDGKVLAQIVMERAGQTFKLQGGRLGSGAG